MKNDKIQFVENFLTNNNGFFTAFISDKDEIKWGPLVGQYYHHFVLNRKSLVLKKVFNHNEKVVTVRQCKLFKDFKSFSNDMKRLASAYQRKYLSTKKGNKI